MSALRAVAAVMVLAAVGLQTRLGTDRTQVAEAKGTDVFADADNDMVPDCIEWLANTDPTKADSDGDGIDDFEEILTFTNHDPSITTKPVDHSMRVLVTSAPNSNGHSDVFLHLMIRFINLRLHEIVIHDIYANVGGVDYSLLQVFGYGEVRVSHRTRERDGVSYLFSIRMSSQEDLMRILPCTIGAKAVLGGKFVNAGSLILRTGRDMAAVMPFTSTTMMLQPVNSAVFIQDANPYYRGGGRVCEMSLSTIGTSNGGTLCEVDWARCRPAANLRCSSNCPSKTGTTVVIPGGLGTITGGG